MSCCRSCHYSHLSNEMVSCSWSWAALGVNNSNSEWECLCVGASSDQICSTGDKYLSEVEVAVFSRKEWRVSRAPGDGAIVWKSWNKIWYIEATRGLVLIPQDTATSWLMLYLQHLWKPEVAATEHQAPYKTKKHMCQCRHLDQAMVPRHTLVKTTYSSISSDHERDSSSPPLPQAFLSRAFPNLRLSSTAN